MPRTAEKVTANGARPRISPFLWFADEAEAAARLYTSVFPNSRITERTHYGEEGREIHGREPGSVQTVAFELDGQPFTALNGGPLFTFNESISFQVHCETQEEADHYWEKLSEGGDEKAQVCGWLKDRFGVSWQVVPTALPELLRSGDAQAVGRVTSAMLRMKKLDVAELRRAYAG